MIFNSPTDESLYSLLQVIEEQQRAKEEKAAEARWRSLDSGTRYREKHPKKVTNAGRVKALNAERYSRELPTVIHERQANEWNAYPDRPRRMIRDPWAASTSTADFIEYLRHTVDVPMISAVKDTPGEDVADLKW